MRNGKETRNIFTAEIQTYIFYSFSIVRNLKVVKIAKYI